MRQTASLMWKEWREARAYLWIAVGVFIGLPVIRGVEAIFQHWRRFEVSTSPWVLAFGGVLAVFVAVSATCRDFSGHLDDFWRSRPISTTRWLLMKYFVGLVVVLAACLLPPIVEIGINGRKDALPQVITLIVCFPFIWIASYSLGFLSGCLVRRTAQAAMLGLAALLLVNFLPMVLPPLHWLDVSTFVPMTLPDLRDWQRVLANVDRWRQLELLMRVFGPLLKFAGGMLGIAVVALSLALLAVRRDWRIDSGRKMMYGSVSAALLILVSSAAFQLGTSLPILQEVDMPNGEQIMRLEFDGHRGYAISEPVDELSHYSGISHFSYRTVELTASGIKLGEPETSNGPLWDATQAPEQPEIGYHVEQARDFDNTFVLMLNASDARTSHQIYSRQPLWELQDENFWPIATICAWKNRLFVIGTHLATLDISQPSRPRIISNTPFEEYLGADFEYGGTTRPSSRRTVPNGRFEGEMEGYFVGADRMLLALPQVPGLPPRQRLEVAMKELSYWSANCFEGEIVCTMSSDNTLLAYRLMKLTDSAAVFEKIGQHGLTMLTGVFGPQHLIWGGHGMKLQNGLLYVTYGSNDWVSFAQHYELINPSINVFDTQETPPMRQVGHFAAPGVFTVCPLPDGRALVGGDKLWLVGPPPHRGQD